MSCGCETCSITPTIQTQISVAQVEVALLAANANRKNATIQNLGATALSIYFTSGAGATAPYSLSQGDIWNAAQPGVGVYRGAVFGIRASGTSNAGVVEET